MPGLPYAVPVTLYEIWRNNLHDLGYSTVTEPTPIELINILKGLDYGVYQTDLAVFGNGVDGTLTFTTAASDVLTLWNGTTLTGTSGVFTLNQDLWLADQSTINAGVTINTAGFRIFCQGELINNGTIRSNGNAGNSNTAGVALSYTGTISATTVGAAGGAGGANNGSNAANTTNALGGTGGAGGASNNGANDVGGLGGVAAAANNTIQLPFSAPYAVTAHGGNGTALQVFTGGAGGGGGAGDGTNLGGGGGGGGGIVVVVAQRLTSTGTGIIQANGGAGGANNTANASGGGGGGGGGGCVIVVSRTVEPKAVNTSGPIVPTQTIQALGGAGGAGITLGLAGVAGNNGTTILLPA